MSEEKRLAGVTAGVLSHQNGQWVALDGPALSSVGIWYNERAKIYRIVAMCNTNKTYLINSVIDSSWEYQRATDLFLQWKEKKAPNIYTFSGLSFASAQDGNTFTSTLESVLASLKEQTTTTPPQPQEQPVPTTNESSKPIHKSSSSSSTPPIIVVEDKEDHNRRKVDDKEDHNKRKNSIVAQDDSVVTRIGKLGLDAPSSSSRSFKQDKKDKKGFGFRTVARKSIKKEDLLKEVQTSDISVEQHNKMPKLVQHPVEMLSARELVIREIFTSEYSYVNQLNIVCDVYEKAAKGILSQEDVKSIFSNVSVIREFNSSLLLKLHKSLDSWTPNSLASPPIASIFLEICPFLKLYHVYCDTYELSIKKLEESRKRKDFALFLKNTENSNPSLNSLLITPVQRIPRYLLLLKELLKKTSEQHEEYSALTSAIDKVSEIVDGVNSRLKKADTFKRLVELKHKITDLESVLAPHREYIKDGPMETWLYEETRDGVDTKERFSWCLLFTDIICFAAPPNSKESNSSESLQIKEIIPLESVWNIDGIKEGKSFELKTPDSTYMPVNLSLEDQQQWSELISSTILTYLQSEQAKRNNISAVPDSSKSEKSSGKKRRYKFNFKRGRHATASYDGEWSNSLMHGEGSYISREGHAFTGRWKEGRFHGSGKVNFTSGESYSGHWRDNLPYGKGSLKTVMGVYEGDFKHGKKHGNGTMKWDNGARYKGEWENDMMHGKGEFTGVDGSVYNGEWREHRREGRGIFTSAQGWKYEGEWKDNERDGEGTMYYANGDVYIGQWKKNKRHGKGSFSSGDGNVHYSGEWSEDKMHGTGSMVIKNEVSYEGEFKDGKWNGVGKAIYANKSTYEGDWKDGKKMGQGVWVDARGATYTGKWHNDMRFGRGKFEDVDGSKYDGEWVNDHKEGKGVIFYKNGDSYFGSWKCDMRHGLGAFTKANGIAKYEGDWKDNMRYGKGIQKDHFGVYEGDWEKDMKHGDGVLKCANGDVFTGKWKMDQKHGKFTVKRANNVTQELEYIDGRLKVPSIFYLAPELPPPPNVLFY